MTGKELIEFYESLPYMFIYFEMTKDGIKIDGILKNKLAIKEVDNKIYRLTYFDKVIVPEYICKDIEDIPKKYLLFLNDFYAKELGNMHDKIDFYKNPF